jgi:hypothetical protein
VFKDEPRAAIAAEVEPTAMRLLEDARFDDYVPVLVHTYVHETPRNHGPAVTAIVEAA